MTNSNGARCPECQNSHRGAEGELCDACMLRVALRTEDPPEPNAPAESIGNWSVQRPLGDGGMGVVFLVHEIGSLNRVGALKQIKHGLDSVSVLERFDQERRVLAKLDHPGIARILDAGQAEDNSPYFVMEYVDGVSITEYCDQHQLDPASRLELFLQVCDAVDHAHRRGILHRDLKPSNILVREEDRRVKVIDFGVARAIAQQRLEWSVFTEFGRLVGTPEYMSPEQADLEHDHLDTRSDVYGLGVVLYELLVGSTPHDPSALRALGLEALLKTIREGSFPTPSSRLSTAEAAGTIAANRGSQPERLRRGIVGELDWIVMRATAVDRERRYASPRELGDDLRRFLNQEPVLAGPPSLAYTVRKWVSRHRLLAFVSIAMIGALLLGSVGLAIGLRRARSAEAVATTEKVKAQTVTDFFVGMFRSLDADDVPLAEVTAIEALDQGAERLRESFPDDPEMRATILHELGDAYENLEFFDKALPLLQEALELRREHLDPGDPRIARSEFLVGVVHAERSEYDLAIPYYRRSLAILEQAKRVDAARLVNPLRSLGNALRMTGEIDAAATAHQRAVDLARDEIGPDSQLYAMTLDNLAALELTRGNLDRAEPLFKEAIRVHSLHSPDGISAARARANYSNVFVQTRRFEEAVEQLERALEVYDVVYGETHPQTVSTRGFMAKILGNLGDLDGAVLILERSLKLLERDLGERHDMTATARIGLARLYQKQGQLDQAVQLLVYQRSLLTEPSDQADLAQTEYSLGRLAYEQGRWGEALASQQTAGDIFERLYGESHPFVISVIPLQGAALIELGRVDEGLQRLERAISLARATDLSDPNLRLGLADALDPYGRLLADLGRHRAAVEAFDELLVILVEVMGEDYAPLEEIREVRQESVNTL